MVDLIKFLREEADDWEPTGRDYDMGMRSPTAQCLRDAADEIERLNTALEQSTAETMALLQVLGPFALFCKPAAVELAGGNPDKIATVLLEYEHQSISLGCFLMAREVWDEINASPESNTDD